MVEQDFQVVQINLLLVAQVDKHILVKALQERLGTLFQMVVEHMVVVVLVVPMEAVDLSLGLPVDKALLLSPSS
jgi:hypothetical protein